MDGWLGRLPRFSFNDYLFSATHIGGEKFSLCSTRHNVSSGAVWSGEARSLLASLLTKLQLILWHMWVLLVYSWISLFLINEWVMSHSFPFHSKCQGFRVTHIPRNDTNSRKKKQWNLDCLPIDWEALEVAWADSLHNNNQLLMSSSIRAQGGLWSHKLRPDGAGDCWVILLALPYGDSFEMEIVQFWTWHGNGECGWARARHVEASRQYILKLFREKCCRDVTTFITDVITLILWVVNDFCTFPEELPPCFIMQHDEKCQMSFSLKALCAECFAEIRIEMPRHFLWIPLAVTWSLTPRVAWLAREMNQCRSHSIHWIQNIRDTFSETY